MNIYVFESLLDLGLEGLGGHILTSFRCSL